MTRIILILFVLGACTSEPNRNSPAGDPLPGDPAAGDSGGDQAGDPGGDAFSGDPGPGSGLERCGLEDYAWLPSDQVGAVAASTKEHNLDQVGLAILQATIESEYGVGLTRSVDHDVDMYSLRYLTQDRGQPIEATGMVIYPDVDVPTEFPVILFLHGTTGATDICAPSLDIGDNGSDQFKAALLLALFASYGYIVVAPDYIGMKASGTASPELHPYLVGEATAIAAWDALRATEALLATETSGNTTAGSVAVWGASQGGHAAAFTVRFGPYYAPEYDVAAGVYAIPPSDLSGHAEAALTTIRNATSNMVLFFSTAEQWYRVEGGMAEVFLSPYDTQLQPDLMAACSPDTVDGVTALGQLFTTGILTAAQSPGFDDFQPWACIVQENSLTLTSVERLDDVPGLFIVAENDNLVDPAIERAAFTTLCATGMQLQYLECQGAGHGAGFSWSIDDALDFIEDRLDGVPTPLNMCELDAATVCSNTP